MNRAFLMGNVGADPELKVTQSGASILKFRLATSEKWKDDNGQQKERTDWHSCTMWGKRAEALHKYIEKGSKLVVEGSIRYSDYEDKDGNKRYRTDINVSNIEFAGGGNGGGQRPAQSIRGNGNTQVGGDYRNDDTDSVPF